MCWRDKKNGVTQQFVEIQRHPHDKHPDRTHRSTHTPFTHRHRNTHNAHTWPQSAPERTLHAPPTPSGNASVMSHPRHTNGRAPNMTEATMRRDRQLSLASLFEEIIQQEKSLLVTRPANIICVCVCLVKSKC